MNTRLKNAMIWVFGALGGILWGYDTGVISSSLIFIQKQFGLTALEQGLIASALAVGAVVGAVGCGPLADRYASYRLCRHCSACRTETSCSERPSSRPPTASSAAAASWVGWALRGSSVTLVGPACTAVPPSYFTGGCSTSWAVKG